MCVRLMDSGQVPKEKNHSQSVSLVMDTFIQEIVIDGMENWGGDISRASAVVAEM